MEKETHEAVMKEQDESMSKALRQRFNMEKMKWQEGLLVWLVCFLALQVLGMIWARIQITNIIINVIILVLLYISHNKFKKKIGHGKKNKNKEESEKTETSN